MTIPWLTWIVLSVACGLSRGQYVAPIELPSDVPKMEEFSEQDDLQGGKEVEVVSNEVVAPLLPAVDQFRQLSPKTLGGSSRKKSSIPTNKEDKTTAAENFASTFSSNWTISPFGTSDPVAQSWVLEGGKAALSCNTQAKDPNEQVATVLWYKGSQGEPIYTYDARSRGNVTHWSEDSPRGFGGRARFVPSQPVAVLFLHNISHQEGGLYRCRVDFHKSQTKNYLLNLSVIVPPETPILTDKKGHNVKSSTIGPFNQGDSLTLICKSSGGSPLPTLIWLTDNHDEFKVKSGQKGDPMTSSSSSSSSSTTKFEISADGKYTRNLLFIPVLTPQHFAKSYRCQAKNNNATKPASIKVTIDMKLLPRTVSIVGPEEEPLSISRVATLKCMSSGSRPPATITWWKKGKFMGKAPQKVIGNDGIDDVTSGGDGGMTSVSTISFRPKVSDHRKNITCRAENTQLAGSKAIDHTITLNVHYPPKAKLILGNGINPSRISEGNDVYMDCQVRSNPKAYKIEWIHNGLRVFSNPKGGARILAGGKSLVLQSITRKFGGNYSCIAYNLEGEDTSNNIKLDILYKPECVTPEPVTLGFVPKRDAEILCRVRSLPAATHFRWTFNTSLGNKEVITSNTMKQQGHPNKVNRGSNDLSETAAFKFRAESEKEFGKVHCFATNALGESIQPCIFTIIPAGPPEAPSDCDVHNHTMKSLIVTCGRIGFGGGDQRQKQSFHIETRDRQSGTLLQNQTKSTPTFTIKEIGPSKGLNLRIYSSNSFGRSSESVKLETSPSKVAELQSDSSASKHAGSQNVKVGATGGGGVGSGNGDTHVLNGILTGLIVTVAAIGLTVTLIVSRRRRSGGGAASSGGGSVNKSESIPMGGGTVTSHPPQPVTSQHPALTTPSSGSSGDDPDLIRSEDMMTVDYSNYANAGDVIGISSRPLRGKQRRAANDVISCDEMTSPSSSSLTGLEHRPPPPPPAPSLSNHHHHHQGHANLIKNNKAVLSSVRSFSPAAAAAASSFTASSPFNNDHQGGGAHLLHRQPRNAIMSTQLSESSVGYATTPDSQRHHQLLPSSHNHPAQTESVDTTGSYYSPKTGFDQIYKPSKSRFSQQ